MLLTSRNIIPSIAATTHFSAVLIFSERSLYFSDQSHNFSDFIAKGYYFSDVATLNHSDPSLKIKTALKCVVAAIEGIRLS